jgi:PAS domain S-box-containing protein
MSSAANLRAFKAATNTAARLLARKKEIIQQWEKQVKAEISKAREIPELLLRDSLPYWLDHLASALASPEKDYEWEKVNSIAMEHGGQRARVDFDFGELLLEFIVLRRVLLEVLERDQELPLFERDLILDAVQLSMRASVAEFLRLKRKGHGLELLGNESRNYFQRILLTICILGAATLAQWLAWDVLQPLAYILFYPAVVLASLYGNATLSILLSIFLAEFVFIRFDAADFLSRNEVARILIFAAGSTIVAFVTRALRASRRMMETALLEQQQARREADRTVVELQQTKRLLLDQQARFELALRAGNIGVWEWDIHSGEIIASNRVSEILGFEPSQTLPYKSFLSIVHQDDRELYERRVSEALSGTRDFEMEYRVSRKDGTHWVQANGKASMDPSGKAYAMIGTVIDITERKTSEILREQFVSALSHDLRTPLTAARMSAQLAIRAHADPGRALKYANSVIQSIDRTDQMIRDLLDVNLIRAGKRLPIEREAIDLSALLQTTIEELTTIHGDRFRLASDGPAEGEWDGNAIRRMVENLCSNAVKYGSPSEPVLVSLRTSPDAVEIAVHNEGNPIPEAQHEKLFDYFHRAPGQPTSHVSGWGIGLTLVKGVAEAHGGKILVSSVPGDGTTFTVTLPRRSGIPV